MSVAATRFALLLVLLERGCLAELPLDGPVVELPQGTLQGRFKNSYRNRVFSAFEGIPFAEPPVGDLRFEAPRALAQWSGTLHANKQFECLQYVPIKPFNGPRGTEDCLYLYVYVPRQSINSSELLDVVVHIHGGAFMIGAPKLFGGPDYIMDRDVVYVTFNYRLGVLGFLSTEDRVVPGNNGLKDQSLALLWIKKNIKHFGGNPASITITGLSAGAASVHLHYFSPLSKGLFHRGYSQSGTALQPWTISEEPLDRAIAVAKKLNCSIATTRKMVDCLKTINGKKLVVVLKTMYIYMDLLPLVLFGPVIEVPSEDAFLSERPYSLLKRGEVYDVPWVTSNTREEAEFFTGLMGQFNKFEGLDEKWFEIMPRALEMTSTVKPSLQKCVLVTIRDYYLKSESITKENLPVLAKLFTDRMFLIHAEKAARMQADATRSEVYYYLFAYVLKISTVTLAPSTASVHGDDGRLYFKTLMTPMKLPRKDEQMMDIFMDFVAFYARKGVPKLGPAEWLPVNTAEGNFRYLQIDDPDNITMKNVSNLAPVDFWNSLAIEEGEFMDSFSSKRQSDSVVFYTSVIFIAIVKLV